MPKICFYFELHQPYRLRDWTLFDIGTSQDYFAQPQNDQNQDVFLKVSAKSYLPMLNLLLKMVKKHPEFRFSLSCSGVFLEQAQRYAPDVILVLKELAQYDRVELLAETYYHSLASLYSQKEFISQVVQHVQLLQSLFGRTPKVFRNTELIYSNQIAGLITQLGFTATLTEAVHRYLHGRKKTQIYRADTQKNLPLLLKHAELSDDIAFRFSDRNWSSYPLHADTYVGWLHRYPQEEFVNLFMDFETFGEHQWADTGIFSFFEHLIEQILLYSWNSFVTPSMVVNQIEKDALPVYSVPEPISWADVDRDLSAWRDNQLQRDSLRAIYACEDDVIMSGDKALIKDWRKLQTSDHFYYMCIKWSADGDVHSYFSPYRDPELAFTRYSTVMADLECRVIKLKESKHTQGKGTHG